MFDARGNHTQNRPCLVDNRRVTANHHRQCSLARAFNTAGDRCIEKDRSDRPEPGRGLCGCFTADRGCIQDNRICLQTGQQGINDLQQVFIRRHGQYDQLALLRQRCRISRNRNTDFRGELLRLCRRPVPERHEKSRRVQVARHGFPHGAKTDDAGFHNCMLLLLNQPHQRATSARAFSDVRARSSCARLTCLPSSSIR